MNTEQIIEYYKQNCTKELYNGMNTEDILKLSYEFGVLQNKNYYPYENPLLYKGFYSGQEYMPLMCFLKTKFGQDTSYTEVPYDLAKSLRKTLAFSKNAKYIGEQLSNEIPFTVKYAQLPNRPADKYTVAAWHCELLKEVIAELGIIMGPNAKLNVPKGSNFASVFSNLKRTQKCLDVNARTAQKIMKYFGYQI